MTIEIKIPAGQLALQYHIGQALRNAAIESGYDVGPEWNADKAIGIIRVATAGEDIGVGQPVVVKAGEASVSVTEKFTPPEAEFTAEEAKEVIGNADENPLKDALDPDTPDADGIVWDKRIHSQGQTRNADGTWRLARKPKDKTEEEWVKYIEDVKAELLAVAAAEDSVTLIPSEQYGAAWEEHYGADPVPPAPAADPVPPVTETVADPVPPVTETVADPVPPAPAADPVPPAPAADPVPPAPAQVDEQLTFGKMVASITPLKAKIPADVDFNQFIADIAASMGIPVMNPKAPLAAFATAGPKVLSQVKQAVEGLTHG